MCKQTNTICKPKRIRLFALIINCTVLMKTNSYDIYNIYVIIHPWNRFSFSNCYSESHKELINQRGFLALVALSIKMWCMMFLTIGKDRDCRKIQIIKMSSVLCPCSWWRHQMETFSALLAICVRNSPVTGEFPVQKPVTRSFDVSLICVWVNNRKAGDLRRYRDHYDVTVMLFPWWLVLCTLFLFIYIYGNKEFQFEIGSLHNHIYVSQSQEDLIKHGLWYTAQSPYQYDVTSTDITNKAICR